MKITKKFSTSVGLFTLILVSSCLYAQWTPVNGPVGGNVPALYTDAKGLYIGNQGGFFRSTNNGNLWQVSNSGLTSYDIRSITSKGDTMFVGCFDGLFKSFDNGSTWTNTNATNSTVVSLCSAFEKVFAVFNNYINCSSDYGLSWISLYTSPDNIRSIFVKDNYLFAGTSNGVLRSQDSGYTWTPVNNGLTNSLITSFASIDNYIFVGTGNYPNGYVFRSTNYGNNWEITTNGYTFPNTTSLASSINTLYAGTGMGAFKTTDKGNNWIQINNGLVSLWIISAATSGNDVFVGTQSEGAFKSTNSGLNWSSSNNGLNNQIISSMVLKDSTIFCTTTYSKIFVTTNDGIIWKRRNSGLPEAFYMKSLQTNMNDIYVSAYGIYRTTNNGSYWFNTGFLNTFVNKIFIKNNIIFAAPQSAGVFISTDFGVSWTPSGLSGSDVYSFGSIDNNYCAGTFGIYTSTNNGSTWFLTGASGDVIYCFEPMNNKIYAGGSKVYRSTNLGLSWTQASSYYRIINSLNAVDSNLFACTYNGIFLTTNSGNTWVNVSDGLHMLNVSCFIVKDNFAYIGTGGNSIYKRPLSELVGIQNISNYTPDKFSLSQNYPNPFNPRTKINIQIAKTSNVRLVVYDAIGREVETIVNEQLKSGMYEIEWDGSNYTSGVYFYRLIAGDFIDVKKMVLLK